MLIRLRTVRSWVQGTVRHRLTVITPTAIPWRSPPGRKGKSPSLTLDYRSSNPVHGAVAAGWQIAGMPAITVDPAAGTFSESVPNAGTAANPRNFLGPDGNPLVKDPSLPVSAGGVAYRSLHDPTFTRFEYLGNVSSAKHWWHAYQSDGTVLRYGLKTIAPWSYTPIAAAQDADGHQLRFSQRNDLAVAGA
ncbi:SpvB/TcaC N-terminal domain-containing protein [Streptomyces cinereoruber]|uniref:SpvB/TcaC N-terminal domain-containing protein n=1 Tax=Streptomyces cinereoruber TaxID=67260 RepID=UPI003642F72E